MFKNTIKNNTFTSLTSSIGMLIRFSKFNIAKELGSRTISENAKSPANTEE